MLSIYDGIPFSPRAVALSRRLERVQLQRFLPHIRTVFAANLALDAKPTRRAVTCALPSRRTLLFAPLPFNSSLSLSSQTHSHVPTALQH